MFYADFLSDQSTSQTREAGTDEMTEAASKCDSVGENLEKLNYENWIMKIELWKLNYENWILNMNYDKLLYERHVLQNTAVWVPGQLDSSNQVFETRKFT